MSNPALPTPSDVAAKVNAILEQPAVVQVFGGMDSWQLCPVVANRQPPLAVGGGEAVSLSRAFIVVSFRFNSCKQVIVIFSTKLQKVKKSFHKLLTPHINNYSNVNNPVTILQ